MYDIFTRWIDDRQEIHLKNSSHLHLFQTTVLFFLHSRKFHACFIRQVSETTWCVCKYLYGSRPKKTVGFYYVPMFSSLVTFFFASGNKSGVSLFLAFCIMIHDHHHILLLLLKRLSTFHMHSYTCRQKREKNWKQQSDEEDGKLLVFFSFSCYYCCYFSFFGENTSTDSLFTFSFC